MVETASDRVSFLADFGVDATWTKRDTSTVAVRVIYDAIYSQPGDGSVVDYVATGISSVFTGVQVRETLTISGAVYSIVDIRHDTTGIVDMALDKQ